MCAVCYKFSYRTKLNQEQRTPTIAHSAPSCCVCLSTVGSVLLMDEAKSDSLSSLSNGGRDVVISMDGDKQRYQQQLQLIDEQVRIRSV